MGYPEHERQDAFNRKDGAEEVVFEEFFPSETKGDGKVRENNRRTGSGQGKGSFVRKASCKICGFLLDLNTNDHGGGSFDGSGAGGSVATATASATLPNGTIHTEKYGTQTYNKGAGCPLCFSKNSAKDRLEPQDAQDSLTRLPPIGF